VEFPRKGESLAGEKDTVQHNDVQGTRRRNTTHGKVLGKTGTAPRFSKEGNGLLPNQQTIQNAKSFNDLPVGSVLGIAVENLNHYTPHQAASG